jgi:CubicO group peptidase (beta-lactamase class C family)
MTLREQAAADVRGTCAPGFEPVRAAFAASFAERGEVGAGLCVTHRGEVVVDLAGGVADPATGAPWEHDTMAMVWSCTKGATAICAHLLCATGELDLDAPVRLWWPEFASDGRETVTLAMLLNHQAGLPGVSEELPAGAVFDFDEMVARMARERPMWEPGTRHGYHSFTYGWLIGEVIRRVTGMLPGEFLRAHVAEPLGADLWIGLPEAQEPRVAPALYAPRLEGAPDLPLYAAILRGDPIQLAMDRSWGEFREDGVCERREARAANIPAVNGIASARGLALLYRPLATDGRIGDVQLPQRLRARMAAVCSASSCDAVTLAASRFSCGFQKAAVPRSPETSYDFPETAFGHGGYGGHLGLADPPRELSIGYALNRHGGSGPDANVRGQALIDAVYAALAQR